MRVLTSLNSWSLDASSILSGEALLYDDFPPSEDPIYSCLVAPSEYDNMTQEILQVLCSAFSSLLSRLVKDHLSGGQHDNPSENLLTETKSVPKTNTISERDFAKLDRLLREKPNAATMSLEALILFSNNKTSQWLHEKSTPEKEELLKKARACGPEFKQLYRARKQHLHEERAKILQAKQRALLRLQKKAMETKEKLTNDLMLYGLWQSESDIQTGLAKLKTKTEMLQALKTQLHFRSKVLEQKYPEKDVFFLSKNKKKLTVDEVTQNLIKLLTPPPSSNAANQESLVGKRIRHRWKESDESEQWYYGRILSLVPGTDDWFNVAYDGESEILSLNLLLDIEKGDLEFM